MEVKDIEEGDLVYHFMIQIFREQGKPFTKSSVTTTFPGRSTSAGEALPPNFKFSAKTTARER